MECKEKMEMDAITNLIALGDNVFEIQAAHKLYEQFKKAFIKTIKFRTGPSPGELNKQLKLVLEQFNHICHSPKNLTVRLHRVESEEPTSTKKNTIVEKGSFTGTGDHTANIKSNSPTRGTVTQGLTSEKEKLKELYNKNMQQRNSSGFGSPNLKRKAMQLSNNKNKK